MMTNRLTWIMGSVLLVSALMQSVSAQEERARLQLDYFGLNNSEHRVVATVKTKEDRSYVNVPDVPVSFYLGDMSEGTLLDRKISDSDGRATIQIPGDLWDTLSRVEVVAAITDNDRFEDYSRDIEVIPAQMHVEFLQDTAENTISVKMVQRDSAGLWVPAGDVAVKVYVQRMFGELPVSVDFNQTGEDGTVLIEFANDIPGDQEGIIEIIVKVQDHELFGNIVHREQVPWGVKGVIEQAHIKHELWSARRNAPMYLVLIVNGLIVAIWLTIAYIGYNMLRILRKGNHEDTTQRAI